MTEQEIGCKTNKQYCFNCQRGVFRLLVWSVFLDKCMLPSSAAALGVELLAGSGWWLKVLVQFGYLAIKRRHCSFCDTG